MATHKKIRKVMRRKSQKRIIKRKNPVVTGNIDDFDYHEPVNLGPVGLPTDPLQSFELGRLVGLQRGLSLCGWRKYFKRQKLSKKVEKEVNSWLSGLSQQVDAVSKGIIGARIPMVRQAEGGIPKKRSGK